MVVVYAPTNVADAADEADEFYRQLADMIQGIPKNDVVMIMGDFNAHVASDSGSDVIGKFCLDKKTNENGERLIDFCALNGLKIMNTWFRKKKIHQGTWQHPATKSWHMIDFVVVNRKYWRSVEDVSVRRRANIESDHNMLLVKMRLHLKGERKKRKEMMRRIDKAKLLDAELVKEAQQTIKERIEKGGEEEDLEEDWDRFKKTMQEVTGGFREDKKERSKKIYMSEETRRILDEKRKVEIAFSDDQSSMNRKQLKKMQRRLRKRLIRDRERWWKAKAVEMEKNMKRNNMGKVFEILNLQKRSKM
jgi:hypothetical protein